MMAQEIVEDFQRRGIQLIADPPKLVVQPASKLTDADRAAIREFKPTLLKLLSKDDPASRPIIEAILRESPAAVPDSHSPAFPPCPSCGQSRYWVVGNRVVCGGKRCGNVRWILTKLEFHTVN